VLCVCVYVCVFQDVNRERILQKRNSLVCFCTLEKKKFLAYFCMRMHVCECAPVKQAERAQERGRVGTKKRLENAHERNLGIKRGMRQIQCSKVTSMHMVGQGNDTGHGVGG
jgi:hypothetical protein